MILEIALLTLNLEAFDQEKLAQLVGNISTHVRQKTVTKLTLPVKGFKVTSVFPKEKSAFQITCESSYFNNSIYASLATCKIELDPNHPAYDLKQDQVVIKIDDEKIVKSVFAAIPFGRPNRDFRSYGRDIGTTYEGRQSNVFHYLFNCSQTECLFKFSHLAAKTN